MSDYDPKHWSFKKYLQGQSEFSRLYRALDKVEPKRSLDAAILAAARRAVEARSRVPYGPFSSRRMVPLSLAAVLALCIGLVVLIYDESGQPIRAWKSYEGINEELNEGVMARGAVTAKAHEGISAASPRSLETPNMRQEQKLSGGGDLKGRGAASGSLNELSKKGAFIAPSEKTAVESNAPIIARDASEGQAPAMKYNGQLGSADKPALSPPMAESASKLSPAGVAAPVARGKRKAEATLDTDDLVTAPAVTNLSVEEGTLPAEEWLAKIKELREQGQLKEAEASLERFKVAFPNYSNDRISAILNGE
ncbi:MAG: hypothetical protein L0Y67_01105 [Gammaproteobacteria bacterium]|nr:hypothetical protein [Gammaproteobacteria bacterium]MCI0590202.1 hypothetical protein [Gammaproteobacteria bacterium]